VSILQDPTEFVRRTNWFLGIGINDYREFPKLNNAVKDVADIGHLLVQKYGFRSEHVFTLFDAQATEENVIGILDDLANKLSKDDTLLIYYSGHGHMTNKGLGFWIPQDAKRGNTARYIANSRIRDIIGTFDAQHVFLISDSCFSGSLLTKGSPRSTRLIQELDKSPSRWALCSGRADEEVDDGIPGTNSPFAKSIMNVLDLSDEAELNVRKIIDRVQEQVAANSRQIPEGHPIQDVGHAWGEYIFRKAGTNAVVKNQTTKQPETRTEELAIAENITTHVRQKESTPTQNKRGVLKILSKGGLILAGLLVIAFSMVTLLNKNNLQVHLRIASERAIEIVAEKGTPWNEPNRSYEITVTNLAGSVVLSSFLDNSGKMLCNYSLFDNGKQGEYTVKLQDSKGAEVVRKFAVPNTFIPTILVNAFHTTSGITKSTWPTDQNDVFKPGETVYAYTDISIQIDNAYPVKDLLTQQGQIDVMFNWSNEIASKGNITSLNWSYESQRAFDSDTALEEGEYFVQLILLHQDGKYEVLAQVSFYVKGQ